MRLITIRLAVSFVLLCLALMAVAAQTRPVPPVKGGLWQVRMSSIDANGQEVPTAGSAALAKLPPEARARMADQMRARGIAMPEADGSLKVCFTKEMFESGKWQQLAAQAGCTTNYSSRSGSTWKWHTSCASLKSESDGESVFSSAESYRTKLTTTSTITGKSNTSTRTMQGKWLRADCGDIKPINTDGIAK